MNNLFLYFLKEEAALLPDKDLYLLYKTYKDKSFKSIMNGDLKKFSKYKEYKDVLKSEILERCK